MQEEFRHETVLLRESVEGILGDPDGIYVDCTMGGGGHSVALADRLGPSGCLVGIDQDPAAVQAGRLRLAGAKPTVHVVRGNFREIGAVLDQLGIGQVDGILFDLGVSSHQIDLPQRGFSYMNDGPLDMRFDSSQGPSAADLVNNLPEKELADIIWRYGEERFSRRVAKAIVHARPFASTLALAEVVRKAVGRSQEKQDPATRTFQSLRIAVNDELKTIEQAIPGLIALLKPHGRVAVISFHSLEDRLVKQTFQRESRDCVCPPEQPVCTCGHKALIRVLTHRPIMATGQETTLNPRARSARLRVAERIN